MAEPQRPPFGRMAASSFFGRRGMADNELTQTEVTNSGNSNVDMNVIVEMDTKPIAYAMLCSLLATKQINYKEFEDALEVLEGLIKKDEKARGSHEDSGTSKVKLFNQNTRKDSRYE